jgi:RNA polymerase sigma-70 factor (ECF subfamily)
MASLSPVADSATGRSKATPPHAERVGRVLPFPDVAHAELDDAALAEILVEGDPRALRAAWQRFAPMVHRMLKRAFGPESDVDDLVQEVFLTLLKRVHTLREPRALKAFVIAITAHMVRYELRRRTALRWLRFGDTPEVAATDPDLDSRQAIVRLYRILDRLGSEDRTVFTLRYLEGLELVDVSQALGLSLATTKRRLTRAWGRVVASASRDGALVDYVTHLEPGAEP